MESLPFFIQNLQPADFFSGNVGPRHAAVLGRKFEFQQALKQPPRVAVGADVGEILHRTPLAALQNRLRAPANRTKAGTIAVLDRALIAAFTALDIIGTRTAARAA